MFNPVSTYRIQFNKEFTFADFIDNVEYFSALGIKAIYASPIFEASPGSMHGYDVTNPHTYNPEIGSEKEFAIVSGKLKDAGIGWIQDIVPNHMAFHNNNLWLMDVLEYGPESEYADFFDIDYSHPEFAGKIMVPFLGKPLEEAINDKEISADILNGKLVVRYFDFWCPVNKDSLDRPADTIYVNELNTDAKLLLDLLNKQNYSLCYWKDSLIKLNYRRFFTVNSLICLRMENAGVFEKYHSFISGLLSGDKINGLRIDHMDGMQKPTIYLDHLRLLTGDETYIVTEKILGLEEELPLDLPVQGTSGYDYLGIVNNLFTLTRNYTKLENFYRELSGVTQTPEELIYQCKKFILTTNMKGEWDNLTRMFVELGFPAISPDLTMESIHDAIGEFLVLFPVYKIYGVTFPLPSADKNILQEVFRKAVEKFPLLGLPLNVLKDLFLNHSESNSEIKDKAISFFLRCMQFTGPLMAKGVEDTVMYQYNCFICHNEVGDHPASQGISIEKYHKLMLSRHRNWPMSMNSTSTHDTKRGEDVRARLNIISELAEEWIENVRQWFILNRDLREDIRGSISPDPNEEYFLYQTLAGAFPSDGKIDESFLSRIDQYIEKSLREAKVNSDWNDINEEHEKAVKDFTRNILRRNSTFMKSFIPLQRKIASFGIINSLSQLILKATAPGIPDFYQGTELWDFSLVDPDNRRPVDYAIRNKMLAALKIAYKNDPAGTVSDLVRKRVDGRLKLWLTYLILEERKADPELFLHGSYVPLMTEGRHSENLIAYARVYNNSWIIVAVPLFIADLQRGSKEPTRINWGKTSIILPELAPDKWKVSMSGSEIKGKRKIPVSDIMKFPLPVFLRSKEDAATRSAGVLAHISSLPGKYGTGDLGPEAYRFADLLNLNGQSFWQVLPFNPVGEGFSWSPYSSSSAFAGNTLFVNPDLLVRSGLIREEILKTARFEEKSVSDLSRAANYRSLISDEVFTSFFCLERPLQHAHFENFCRKQGYWLHDYALFNIIKREFGNKPWNEWPKKYRNRIKGSLLEIEEKYSSELKKEKLMQYLFNEQWLALRKYCNSMGIKIIGDLSFYVNYDSADLWAHPELFNLNIDRIPLTVAGVPPDYFSETGQLWNMPVYAWDRMKRDGFSWWMNRIKRNMELCDVLRFDHFRAFSEYWEVPFGEKTAINGKWIKGPGYEFFDKVTQEYPGMPFIAEDLGSIDDKVYRLRDDYNLPGMAILQFAFGDNTPRSGYIPHNYNPNCVVYSGTHDNNTTKGWYLNELTDQIRKEISEYAGHMVTAENCHEEIIRMAYRSVARIAIIPVQDLLGLNEAARLNKPSSSDNNWTWKMKSEDMDNMFSSGIRRMIRLYGRI